MKPVFARKAAALAVIMTSALSLAACASLAPYQPMQNGRGQGYSEQQIEQNRARISYSGVGDPRRVADRALYRAAQVTLNQGYEWFEVTQSWTDGRPDSAGGIRPNVAISGGSGRYGGYRSSGLGVGVGLDLSGPSATSTTLDVVMGRGEMPPQAYTARGVLDSLGPRL